MDKKIDKLFKKYTENDSAIPPAKIRLELSSFFEKTVPGSFLAQLNEKKASETYIYSFPGYGTLPPIRKRISGSPFSSFSSIPYKDWENHFRGTVLHDPEESILISIRNEDGDDKVKDLNHMSIQIWNFYRSLKKESLDMLEIEVAYLKEMCVNFAKLWKRQCHLQLKTIFQKAKDYFPVNKQDIFRRLKTSTIGKEPKLDRLHEDWLFEIMIFIQWASLLLPDQSQITSLWDEEIGTLNNLIDYLDKMNQEFMKDYVAFCEHDVDFENTYQKLLRY